jgi:hypothetical protein
MARRWIIATLVVSWVFIAPMPSLAASVLVEETGLSDSVLQVRAGEPVTWVDNTGQALRVEFDNVQGASIRKEFEFRRAHVVFDRPGKYSYRLFVGDKVLNGTVEVR